MRALFDVNVLIALHDSDHVHHHVASAWLQESGGHGWASCPLTQNGCLRIKARAALAGYVLRRWNVDASPDHRLDPAAHQLWLRNTQTLYGVESAALAPGYGEVRQSAAKA